MIVGSGPLADQLVALVGKLGLGDSVVFTGLLANPYVVMAASDCFVMSSNYEGQPMVILEALIVGLPVVTVAFGSAADALPSGFGLVTASTVEALADGMRAYLRGEVPAPKFDVARYDHDVIREFYAAVGVGAIEAAPVPDARPEATTQPKRAAAQ